MNAGRQRGRQAAASTASTADVDVYRDPPTASTYPVSHWEARQAKKARHSSIYMSADRQTDRRQAPCRPHHHQPAKQSLGIWQGLAPCMHTACSYHICHTYCYCWYAQCLPPKALPAGRALPVNQTAQAVAHAPHSIYVCVHFAAQCHTTELELHGPSMHSKSTLTRHQMA